MASIKDPSSSFLPSISDEVKKSNDSSNINRFSKRLTMIEDKLKFYHFECNRYGAQWVKIVEKCLQEECEICNLNDYMITTLGCKVMFESFAKYPISPLQVGVLE